jgi:hypothetical protein
MKQGFVLIVCQLYLYSIHPFCIQLYQRRKAHRLSIQLAIVTQKQHRCYSSAITRPICFQIENSFIYRSNCSELKGHSATGILDPVDLI